ncbi:MAG: ribonuclease H-like domain-containing protein [Polyangiaceae bacterium]|nr:ribonuclease H-like domain-containing protein [Polyangiaceae bacterium]
MAKSYLVLDIETVLDPELPIAESSEAERLPAPPHHKIVVIGVLLMGADYGVRRLGVVGEGKEEAVILNDFAQFLEERRPCLVTYNGRGFDMPVIANRCFRHGITLRHYYAAREVRYRFSPDGHLDLMDYLADFGAAKPSRLDVVAKLCGMPGKVGVAGKDVGPMVHAGRISEVRNYCLCDVVQTAAVFLRVQLLRGELGREAYISAMRGLLDLVRTDPRVSAVAPGMNDARLLLDERDEASVSTELADGPPLEVS